MQELFVQEKGIGNIPIFGTVHLEKVLLSTHVMILFIMRANVMTLHLYKFS
jgi:hypothetical protein